MVGGRGGGGTPRPGIPAANHRVQVILHVHVHETIHMHVWCRYMYTQEIHVNFLNVHYMHVLYSAVISSIPRFYQNLDRKVRLGHIIYDFINLHVT